MGYLLVRKATPTNAKSRASVGLCEVGDPCMLGNSMRENREVPPVPDTTV